MRATFKEISLAIGCFLASAVYAQEPPEDNSPHTLQFVQVAEDVELEVVDWRGRGRAVVLLAGLGMTAHDFDEFAPKLAKHFRVVGITRRGFGASSRPATGYSVPQLAADVIAVIDAIKVNRPLLIGHSISGQELSFLGVAHPDRFSGLVYLDAAFDYTDQAPAEYMALLKAVDPDSPALRFNMNERPASLEGLSPNRQILASTLKPEYSKIALPALSIFAVSNRAGDMFPDYEQRDAEARAKMDRMFVMSVENAYLQRDKFRNAPKSQAIGLVGAKHYIHRTNEAEVLDSIVKFGRGLAR